MILSKKHFAISLLIALITLLLDQGSKWWVVSVVDLPSQRIIEVTSFFNLAMVWNHGVSFGMFSSHQQPLLLSAVAIGIVGVLLVWLAKSHDRFLTCGIGLIIGGAIGNVIDRLRFQAVVDFLDFHAFGYHWPAFNIADSGIFIGVVVLCIQSMMQPSKSKP